MNIQKVFEDVAAEPGEHTLVVAVRELENQGCRVLVDGKYLGSDALPCSSARSLFQSGLCSLT